jgi:hypothetical protein
MHVVHPRDTPCVTLVTKNGTAENEAS